jgi:hypothetical protein
MYSENNVTVAQVFGSTNPSGTPAEASADLSQEQSPQHVPPTIPPTQKVVAQGKKLQGRALKQPAMATQPKAGPSKATTSSKSGIDPGDDETARYETDDITKVVLWVTDEEKASDTWEKVEHDAFDSYPDYRVALALLPYGSWPQRSMIRRSSRGLLRIFGTETKRDWERRIGLEGIKASMCKSFYPQLQSDFVTLFKVWRLMSRVLQGNGSSATCYPCVLSCKFNSYGLQAFQSQLLTSLLVTNMVSC